MVLHWVRGRNVLVLSFEYSPLRYYQTIAADPPWNESGGGKIKRGADRHYPLLKTPEIIEVMLGADCWHPADDCHLYLWTTNNKLRDGLEVMEALGFRYVTMLTWAKDRIGLGYYFRGQTEPLLFGVRGKLKPKVRTQSTLISAPRRKHSQKPDSAYLKMEKVSPGPRLEMFARSKRKGWDVWGNEVVYI